MSAEQGPASPEPDDFERQLRDITSGIAEAPRFTEPSAAERARQAAKRANARSTRQASPLSWRTARKAKKLRRPTDRRGRSGRQPRIGRTAGGTGRSQVRTPWRRRLRSAGKMVVILLAFVALLVVLRLLGFGPH